MAYKNQMLAIPMQSLSATTFTNTYELVTDNGLGFSCAILRIINATSVNLLISYDGSTDHDFVFSGESFQLDAASNSALNAVANFSSSFNVWVKAVAGTGDVYVTGYYQPTGV